MSEIRRPPGPHSFLPGGGLLRMRRDPLALLLDMAQKYGDVSHVRTGDRQIYLLNHPDYIKDLLVTNSANFVKSIAVQKMKVFLGEGLLTSEGDYHERQRRLIQPAFHAPRIDAYAQIMADQTRRVGGGWQGGQTLDIAKEMTRLTMSIVAKTLFGAELETEAKELGAALTTLLKGFRLFLLPFGDQIVKLQLPVNRRFRQAGEQLNRAIGGIIAARHERPSVRDDLLSALLAARGTEGDGGRMNDEQVRDEAMTLFVAGHETTANALAWTWYLLSQHPSVEARFHAELDSALDGQTPGAASLPRLTYTAQILMESMRLYPPAWVIGRQTLRDYSVGGYVVPAGAIVFASQWAMHHDPRYYPDPFRFDPDRRLPEARAARPRFTYFPFGAGPRVCIGESFAWTESILVLAILAQRWKMRLEPGQRIVPLPLVTLRPKHGIRMTLQRRSRAEH